MNNSWKNSNGKFRQKKKPTKKWKTRNEQRNVQLESGVVRMRTRSKNWGACARSLIESNKNERQTNTTYSPIVRARIHMGHLKGSPTRTLSNRGGCVWLVRLAWNATRETRSMVKRVPRSQCWKSVAHHAKPLHRQHGKWKMFIWRWHMRTEPVLRAWQQHCCHGRKPFHRMQHSPPQMTPLSSFTINLLENQ